MTDWFSGKRVGSLQDEINRVFTDFGFTPPAGIGAAWGGLTSQPRVEVEKTKTGYEIEIAFPFVTGPEQIDAEFRDGKLVITVERPKGEAGAAKVDVRTGSSGDGGQTQASEAGGASGSSGAAGSSSGMMGQGGGASGAGDGRPGGMMGEG